MVYRKLSKKRLRRKFCVCHKKSKKLRRTSKKCNTKKCIFRKRKSHNRNKINKRNRLSGGNITNHKQLIQYFVDKDEIVKNSRLYEALMKVDRGNYCDDDNCYFDSPVRIDEGQTISAPHMHIKALKYLEDKLYPGAKVLDIGSGSGYLTAVFGYLVETNKTNNDSKVIGIDIYPKLVDKSIHNINKMNSDLLKNDKLDIIVGDGWEGYPGILFDAIHVGATAEELPIKLWRQLKSGGKMVIPIQTPGGQIFRLYHKPQYWNRICDTKPYECYKKDLLGVRYVPLQKQ